MKCLLNMSFGINKLIIFIKLIVQNMNQTLLYIGASVLEDKKVEG